ncbi:MAG: hypothetical protein GXO86_08680 [Chlorobi bacterium]|nr:hypothetical protein [Chlorobiota bacterium]
MADWKDIASSKPISAYSIFCGELDYPRSLLKQIRSGNKHGFNSWDIHVKPRNSNASSGEIIRGFDKYYYHNFVNTVFPDHNGSDNHNSNPEFAGETERLSREINKTVEITVRQKTYNIKFEYLDLFFFPHEIVIYCFKCDLTGFSFDDITLVNSFFRNSGITKETKFIFDYLSFIKQSDDSAPIQNSLDFGNKLKVFSLVEHEITITNEEEEMLLYDLGTCSPIGTAAGVESRFQPSETYFRELMENNKISVFSNWSALALFDTFTALFQKNALDNFVWESGYFNLLYLQSLYVKHYLFKINREFFTKGADHQKLEAEFFEFNKYYNPSNISYNFLPPIIYKKIRYGLAISAELNELREGIERADLKHKEKQDKMINDILTVIAFLAVFSAIWDISEWVYKLFTGATSSYTMLSGSVTLIILAVFGIFLVRNYRK